MKSITTAFLLFCAIATHAQIAANDTLVYCLNTNGIGVGGYDPVSYFQSPNPLQGKTEINTKHNGVEYWFSTEKNKSKFVASPRKYLPQFGGWCSMTLAMGKATTPKYDNFAILSGRLYLFERTLSVNGRELWLKDPAKNEKIASENYQSYKATGKIK